MTERALKLKTIEEKPFNAEAPMAALAEAITPANLFYVRNHFDVPTIDPRDWRIAIHGLVEHPLRLSLTQLKRLPERTLTVVMECAGNGRIVMKPTPAGSPWRYGAASTARFTGTAFRNVLDQARPKAGALEVAFTGADKGRSENNMELQFVRSVPLNVAFHQDTLLAWKMNDMPLTAEHGFPVRLVVPRWYGIASVKWLTEADIRSTPFEGHFQTETYVYRGENGTPEETPVSLIRVRSVIGKPVDGDEVNFGPVKISGTSWSGHGRIRSVEVSVDGGKSWRKTHLVKAASRYSATPWRVVWKPRRHGPHKIMVRASDAAGNIQPLSPVWNALGYGNNVVQVIRVMVR